MTRAKEVVKKKMLILPKISCEGVIFTAPLLVSTYSSFSSFCPIPKANEKNATTGD